MNRSLNYLFLLAACTTPQRAADEYGQAIQHRSIKGDRTTIFILVDGLGTTQLQKVFAEGLMPNTYSFFSRNPKIYTARSVFPTLTYPNIASLLTTSPVSVHRVAGNRIFTHTESIDLTSPLSVGKLNGLIKNKTVLSAATQNGGTSLSLDPYFREGSTAHLHREIETGVAYVNNDYSFIDRNSMNSLALLLQQNAPEQWPEFIFVHLIGVDSIAHERGPNHPSVLKYLADLDTMMRASFLEFERGERSGHQVVGFLGSDHGMVDVTKRLNMKDIVHRVSPQITYSNMGRSGALYFPKNFSPEVVAKLALRLKNTDGIALVARKEGKNLLLDSKNKPSLQPSEFVQNLADYFATDGHADMVIIGDTGVSFSESGMGEHGGLDPEEVLTPLIIRNADIDPEFKQPVPIQDVLQFLRL